MPAHLPAGFSVAAEPIVGKLLRRARRLDRALPPTGLAGNNKAVQIILFVLEQRWGRLHRRLSALAAYLLALFAIAQFQIGGTISVIMINAGHITSHKLDVCSVFPSSDYTTTPIFA
jgi:hypothetical protein